MLTYKIIIKRQLEAIKLYVGNFPHFIQIAIQSLYLVISKNKTRLLLRFVPTSRINPKTSDQTRLYLRLYHPIVWADIQELIWKNVTSIAYLAQSMHLHHAKAKERFCLRLELRFTKRIKDIVDLSWSAVQIIGELVKHTVWKHYTNDSQEYWGLCTQAGIRIYGTINSTRVDGFSPTSTAMLRFNMIYRSDK